MRPLVSAVAQWRPRDRYELGQHFFPVFLKRLQEVIAQHHGCPEMNNADFIAMALLRAAFPFETFRAFQGSSRLPEVLQKFVGFPLTKKARFEYEAGGSTSRAPTFGQSTRSTILVRATCGRGKKAPEILHLRIRGKPVRLLTKNFLPPRDHREDRLVRAEARLVFDAICREIGKMVGATQGRGGRPTEDHLRQAAFLRDVYGFSWRQIATLVCPEEHRHNAGCKERLRKGVEQVKRRRTEPSL